MTLTKVHKLNFNTCLNLKRQHILDEIKWYIEYDWHYFLHFWNKVYEFKSQKSLFDALKAIKLEIDKDKEVFKL